MLGVKILVIDMNEKVGDNWWKRYYQLVLYDLVWYDYMLYFFFFEYWLVFMLKDKLVEWFEFYVKVFEFNIWIFIFFIFSKWDEGIKIWEVKVNKGGREERVFRLKYIVLCMGYLGKKFMFDIKGLSEGVFKGLVVYFVDFVGVKQQ